MLTPEYLRIMPLEVQEIYQRLELEIIKDIARRINKTATLTATADYQISRLVNIGYDIQQIKEAVAIATNKSLLEVEQLLLNSSYLSYNNDIELYRRGGKVLPPLSYTTQRYINEAIRNAKFDILNISQTLGVVSDGKAIGLTQFYRDTVNQAIVAQKTGAFTSTQVKEQAIKKLVDSGIRYIGYDTRNDHVDVAVARAVRTTTSQITGEVSENNARLMGQDLMEISQHWGARPSHAEFQGEIVSRSGAEGYLSLTDIGYGEGWGFKGYNCRHDWYPYFEGLSIRAKLPPEPDPFIWRGKEYTYYEATQYQRYLERNIRKSRREVTGYKYGGADDKAKASQVKLNRQLAEYKGFSNFTNLRVRNERTKVQAGDFDPLL